MMFCRDYCCLIVVVLCLPCLSAVSLLRHHSVGDRLKGDDFGTTKHEVIDKQWYKDSATVYDALYSCPMTDLMTCWKERIADIIDSAKNSSVNVLDGVSFVRDDDDDDDDGSDGDNHIEDEEGKSLNNTFDKKLKVFFRNHYLLVNVLPGVALRFARSKSDPETVDMGMEIYETETRDAGEARGQVVSRNRKSGRSTVTGDSDEEGDYDELRASGGDSEYYGGHDTEIINDKKASSFVDFGGLFGSSKKGIKKKGIKKYLKKYMVPMLIAFKIKSLIILPLLLGGLLLLKGTVVLLTVLLVVFAIAGSSGGGGGGKTHVTYEIVKHPHFIHHYKPWYKRREDVEPPYHDHHFKTPHEEYAERDIEPHLHPYRRHDEETTEPELHHFAGDDVVLPQPSYYDEDYAHSLAYKGRFK